MTEAVKGGEGMKTLQNSLENGTVSSLACHTHAINNLLLSSLNLHFKNVAAAWVV